MSSRHRRSRLTLGVVVCANWHRHGIDLQRVLLLDAVAAFYDVANDHADVALAVLACVRLRRLAPSAIQQDARRRHPRGRVHGLLAGDAPEHLDAYFGVTPRPRPKICM